MNVISVTMIILAILVICFIFVGMWFKRMAATADDFLLAGRGAPFWLMASAYLGGYVGGASVSGYVSLGYTGGISGMWTSLFVVSGCVAFILIFSRRVNYFGRKTGAVTIADFICARYGESLRLPVAIVGFMRPGFLTGMQFLAIAVVANIVFGLDIKIGVVVSALIIMLYLITAGQYSALITQWFQSVLQSLGIILFAVAAFKLIGNPSYAAEAMYELLEPVKMNFWNVDFSQFTVWLLTFGVFYLVDPWIYMWAYIGQTPKISSNGMLAVLGGSYYNVLPFLSGLCIALGAIMGKLTVPEGLSGDGLYAWFSIEFMPSTLGVVVLVGLLMTIISCGSSFAMNGVTILTRDIYQKVMNKNAEDKQVLRASRVSLIVVTLIGIASALWLPILVPLWSLAQAIGISGLLATTLCAWFWRRSTTAGALSSTVLGGIAAFGWAVYAWIKLGNPGALVPMFGTQLHAAHIGLVIAIPVMIIVSLCTKPEYDKAEATSYKRLGEELRTSSLVVDKQERPGIFGWLGADTSGWKTFWVVVFVVFAMHYVLAFLFHLPAFGVAMIWTSFVVGAIMIFMLAILGGKDLVNMARIAKESEKKRA
ncbi:MAG: sodium:solute symporter family protein [Clostridiales Family XIII bacterium]|jgi:SSS family solute:Na+ symporter|nr:sodium:solute symporter family protein [Clostridiales Family XIII bacterium]